MGVKDQNDNVLHECISKVKGHVERGVQNCTTVDYVICARSHSLSIDKPNTFSFFLVGQTQSKVFGLVKFVSQTKCI